MKKNAVIIGVCMFAMAFMLFMVDSITTRKQAQAELNKAPVITPTGVESRSEKWKDAYPRQYDTWKQTKNNGGEDAGKIEDMLEKQPQLVILWAGYGFAKDYNAPRGHMYSIQSVTNTLRTGAPTRPDTGPMPTACWTCKSTDVPRIMEEQGELEYFTGKWARLGDEIVNPIGCADCHNSQTGQLEISRPYLERALASTGRNMDDVSFQDMRSLACAQCHSEYYFKKTPYTDDQGVSQTAAVVTFPWEKGLRAEDMEEYYNEYNFSDWTNPLSGTPMIKAQHPGYEIFQTGIHAKQGISCADCHMPYKQEGSVKFTNHQIQNPLNIVADTCMTCHRDTEKEFRARVEEKLARKDQLNHMAMDNLATAHLMAKKAWELGATEAEMKPVQDLIRSGQWMWDYSIASHGSFFHAPEETLRLLSVASDKGMQARVKLTGILAKYGVLDYEVPDFSTKEKAQKLVGLDMDKLIKEKKEFRQGLLQQWHNEAEAEGLRNEEAWGEGMPNNASYL